MKVLLHFSKENWRGVLAWRAVAEAGSSQAALFARDTATSVVKQLEDNFGILSAKVEFIDEPGFFNVFHVYVFFYTEADEAEFIMKASDGFEVSISLLG